MFSKVLILTRTDVNGNSCYKSSLFYTEMEAAALLDGKCALYKRELH